MGRRVNVRIPVRELRKVLSIITDDENIDDYIVFRDVEQVPKRLLNV